MRGVNWIPDDAFPHRVDRARYAARLAQTADAGCNLVRVWGGGIYEDDAFYDECDERGLLVWQDVLMACASYAEEEPLRSELLAEVRDNATRLAPHPSLVLWCGGNENLWGFVDWDWDVRLDGKTWGAGYVHDLLPTLLAELDPARPYVPGSPFSPRGADGERAAPQRPGRTGPCTSGRCGTTTTGRSTATTGRASRASSAGRARRPGRPSCARSATTR